MQVSIEILKLNLATIRKPKLKKRKDQLEGVKKTRDEDIFTILECHVNLDIEGFEDMKEGEPTGIKLPYIVTIEEGSRQCFIDQTKL